MLLWRERAKKGKKEMKKGGKINKSENPLNPAEMALFVDMR
jgi:hypothetical protein